MVTSQLAAKNVLNPVRSCSSTEQNTSKEYKAINTLRASIQNMILECALKTAFSFITFHFPIGGGGGKRKIDITVSLSIHSYNTQNLQNHKPN